MSFVSRIREVLTRRPQSAPNTRPVIVGKSQFEEVSRLKEEVDWLAYMVGSDAEFTYGEDGTVQQGRKSQVGPFGAMFSFGWAYSQAYARPGYFACFCITENQHNIIRTRSRAFCSVNPYFKGIQRNIKNHVIGQGHRWTLAPILPGIEVPQAAMAKGQKELNDFYGGYGDANQSYRSYQCEKAERKLRDGEYFLQLIEEDGRLRVKFIEPRLVWSPTNPGDLDGEHEVWFGIKYRKGEYERPLGYYVKRTNMFGSENGNSFDAWNRAIPADEIQHGKCNVDKASPRGIPDTYWVQQRLDQAMRTLKATGTLVQIRAKVGVLQRRANMLQNSVQTLVSEQGMNAVTGGQKREYDSVLNLPDGAFLQSSSDAEFSMPAQNLEIKEITAAIQAELQATATATGLADFMVSGTLGSGASYSASMVSEGPVVKNFAEMQSETITEDRAVATRALEVGVRADRVPEEVLTLCKIEMSGPPLARLGIQEAQANAIKVQGGWKSKTTIQQEEGLDPNVEQENTQREAESEAKQQAELIKKYPEAMAPQSGGNGQSDGGGGTKKARQRQSPNARPRGADEEGRQMQRESGATVEEEMSHGGWSFRLADNGMGLWTQTDKGRSDFGRTYTRELTTYESSRFQEHSSDDRAAMKPTTEDLEMSSLLITPEWLEKTKGEILSLPQGPRGMDGIQTEYEPGVKGVYLGIVDDQQVWAVDMRAMVVKYACPDLICAGNSEKWSFVPEDRIIVDWSFVPYDRGLDVLHECIEYTLMGDGKFAYSRAHRVSNHFEDEWLLEIRPELAALKPKENVA